MVIALAAMVAATLFPPPLVPAENRPTAARVELGRYLFYDARLSANGTQSCASCHQQERAFTDGRATAIGSTGQRHPRNAMTLTNVAYNASLTWTNARITSLEQQARVPMFGRAPVEMGVRGHERAVVSRLRSDTLYRDLFSAAFPAARRPISLRNATMAIAAFERTLISTRAPFDRALAGDHTALSPAAWRGLQLFTSSRLGCNECHAGFNFSGPVRFPGNRDERPPLVSNGITRGRFRVPTLRNVALTAPYMHDGSIATLEEVVDRYAATRAMTVAEKADIVAFLHALTDREFVTDPRFSDPWPQSR